MTTSTTTSCWTRLTSQDCGRVGLGDGHDRRSTYGSGHGSGLLGRSTGSGRVTENSLVPFDLSRKLDARPARRALRAGDRPRRVQYGLLSDLCSIQGRGDCPADRSEERRVGKEGEFGWSV